MDRGAAAAPHDGGGLPSLQQHRRRVSNTADMIPSTKAQLPSQLCVACSKRDLGAQCKICKMWLYCTKACAKNDAKKHKKTCPKLVAAAKTKTTCHLLPNEQKMFLGHQVHLMVLQTNEKVRRPSRHPPTTGAVATLTQAKQGHERGETTRAKLEREKVLAMEKLAQARTEAVNQEAAVAAAQRDLVLARKTVEARAPGAHGYQEPSYWEKRHARDSLDGTTYDWYTAYPERALREAFPSDMRHEKILVIGCGNSELSEKMCGDGFRDVLSVDLSESAVAQMTERARERFFPATTTCRYMVMDACNLGLTSDTFAGVVDKGTLDATITRGGNTARRICKEAMRVLKPGGVFLVISNAPAGILLDALVDMCGREASCDTPLPVPMGKSTHVVYAYTVVKDGGGNGCAGDAAMTAMAAVEDDDDDEDRPSRASAPTPAPARVPAWMLTSASPGGVDMDSGGSLVRRRSSAEEEEREGSFLEVSAGGEAFEIGQHVPTVFAGGNNGARELSELIESFEKENSGRVGTRSGLPSGYPNCSLNGNSSGRNGSGSVGGNDGGSDSSSTSSPRAMDITEDVFLHPEERVKRNGESFQAELAALLQECSLNMDEEEKEKEREKSGDRPDHIRSLILQAQEVDREKAAAAVAAARVKNFEDTLKAYEDHSGREAKELSGLIETKQGQDAARGGPTAPVPTAVVAAADPAAATVPSCKIQANRDSTDSLPWGVNISQYEEDSTFSTVSIDTGAELKASHLSIEFAPTRLKVVKGPPGGDRPTLLDLELTGRIIVADSIWSIEDKTVLTLSLCKRDKGKWLSAFKRDEQLPKVPSLSPADEDAHAHPELSPTTIPPAHESSPGMSPSSHRSVEAPKHFLVEQQDGIKFFQLHVSKPAGREVTQASACRCGPEMIQVRFACRGEGQAKVTVAPRGEHSSRGDGASCEKTSGTPNQTSFVQHAQLGRDDFAPDKAAFSFTTEGEMFVARIPFGRYASGVSGSSSSSSNFGGSGLATVIGEGGNAGVCYGGENDGDDDVLRVARLRCRFCEHHFTAAATEAGGKKGLAMRTLPSGRWDDCIEDMICFPGPTAVPMLARDVTFARPGFCLVGQAEVLVHIDDLVDGALVEVNAQEVRGGKEVREGMHTAEGDRRADSSAGCNDGLHGGDGSENERCLQCARCEFTLGRVATLKDGPQRDGEGNSNGQGMLLLKHCILGDDASKMPCTPGGFFDEKSNHGKDKSLEDKRSDGGGGGIVVAPSNDGKAVGEKTKPVFAGVTSVHFLMAEIEHARAVDRHSRFVVTVSSRVRIPSSACLGLLVFADHTRVSLDGGCKPRRALRVAFREQTLGQAEEEDLEQEKLAEAHHHDRAGDATAAATATPPVSASVANGQRNNSAVFEARGGDGGEELVARTPACVLEVSHNEYESVKQRLVEASWASSRTVDHAYAKLDGRGYRFSYLF